MSSDAEKIHAFLKPVIAQIEKQDRTGNEWTPYDRDYKMKQLKAILRRSCFNDELEMAIVDVHGKDNFEEMAKFIKNVDPCDEDVMEDEEEEVEEEEEMEDDEEDDSNELTSEQLAKLEDIHQKHVDVDHQMAREVGIGFMRLATWIRDRRQPAATQRLSQKRASPTETSDDEPPKKEPKDDSVFKVPIGRAPRTPTDPRATNPEIMRNELAACQQIIERLKKGEQSYQKQISDLLDEQERLQKKLQKEEGSAEQVVKLSREVKELKQALEEARVYLPHSEHPSYEEERQELQDLRATNSKNQKLIQELQAELQQALDIQKLHDLQEQQRFEERQKSIHDYFDTTCPMMEDDEKARKLRQQEDPLAAIMELEGKVLGEQLKNMRMREELQELRPLKGSPDEMQVRIMEYQKKFEECERKMWSVDELRRKLGDLQGDIDRHYQPTIERQEKLLKDYYQSSIRVGILRQKDREALRDERSSVELFRKTQRERDAVVEQYKKRAEELQRTDLNLMKITELEGQVKKKTGMIDELEQQNYDLNNEIGNVEEVLLDHERIVRKNEALRENAVKWAEAHRKLKLRNKQLEEELAAAVAAAATSSDEEVEEEEEEEEWY